MMKLGEILIQPNSDPATMALFDGAPQLFNDGFNGPRRDVGATGVCKKGMQDFPVFMIHDRSPRLCIDFPKYAPLDGLRIDLAQNYGKRAVAFTRRRAYVNRHANYV